MYSSHRGVASRIRGGGGVRPKEASVTGVGFNYQISVLTCYWGGGGGGGPGNR